MAVMARETWTDERLDDLNAKVDKGFDRVDNDIRELGARMDRGFERVDEEIRDLRTEMNTRFEAVDARFDAMQRTMIIGFVSLTGSVVASVLGGILITQL